MMRSLRTLALVAVACGSVAAARQPASDEPTRWESEFAAMDKRDAAAPPPEGGVLFLGSSSIRLWDVAKSFPDLRVVNRGFGGSQIADSVRHFDRLVTPHRPRFVVFYAGDNDIAAGNSEERVLEDFRALVAKLHTTLPETRLIFISIKPSLARWNLADTIRSANRRIQAEVADDGLVSFLDVWQPMLSDDQTPRKELFREDGLHLNEQGYAVWRGALAPMLQRQLEE